MLVSNDVIVAAIRAHHDELAAELQVRTAALVADARKGEFATSKDELHRWYQARLMPHIVAQEQTLYSAAGELDATRLLICGMLAEHRAVVSQIAELALAREAFDVATAAASAQALLAAHLSQENDLLLPALDAGGVDLATVLDGMQIASHAG